MGKLFGTDGIRGIAGQTLTAELAFHVGQAVAAVLTEEKGSRPLITIGKDTRISSDMLEAALMAGICSVGGDVMPLGTIPTPAVAFLTVQQQADAGIVISASHNPYAYNGIKVFNAQGYKLSDEMEGRVEDLILNHAELPAAVDGAVGRRHHGMHALHSAYVQHLLGSIDCDLTGLRVLVDCANGAASATAPQTVPVFAGYLVLGMGYGIYVQSLGLPVWMPMLMGTVVYGGSLEFVLASLLLGTFSPLSAFLMALMIQARHLFYGLAMLERYKGYGLRSFYMIFAMSDETFSITCSAEPPQGIDWGWFMFFITLLDQFYWVASAGLGAVVGSVLPFSTKGVDFVMTAMFVVIFLNQWEKEKQHYSGIIGLAVPLVCLVLFGSGSFLLPSMACILVLLLVLRKPIERADGIVPGQTEKQKEAAQ